MTGKPSIVLYPAPSTGTGTIPPGFAHGCSLKVPHDVHAPLIGGDRAQHVGHLVARLVRDAGMPLTRITSPDMILGILSYRRPEYP
ncbi:hypothetical protein LIER_34161 [Lithospermum erythrorhizon]|uniref:Uncharacterized protein n=1 Tax=Lithospermum erythrorhizon TaxID=34254 RepID=A0AAV3RYV7_LITER